MEQGEKNTHMEILFEFCERSEFYKVCDRLEILNKEPEVYIDEETGFSDVKFHFK
jgi:hypothetical protein